MVHAVLRRTWVSRVAGGATGLALGVVTGIKIGGAFAIGGAGVGLLVGTMLGIAVATRTPVPRPTSGTRRSRSATPPTTDLGRRYAVTVGLAGRRARVRDLRDARGPGRARGDGGDLRPRVRDGPRRSARRVPPAAHGRGRSWRRRRIRDPGRRRAAGRVGARHPLRHHRRPVVRPAARRVRDRAHAGRDHGARRRPHRGAPPPGVRAHDDHAEPERRSHRSGTSPGPSPAA